MTIKLRTHHNSLKDPIRGIVLNLTRNTHSFAPFKVLIVDNKNSILSRVQIGQQLEKNNITYTTR